MNVVGAQQHVSKETAVGQPSASNFHPNGENRAHKRNNGSFSKNSYLVRAVGVCDDDGSWTTAAGCGGPGWMNREKVFKVVTELAQKLANKDLEIETFRERQAKQDRLIRDLLNLTRSHLQLRHTFFEFAKFAMVRFSCRETEAIIDKPLEDQKKMEDDKLFGKYFAEEMKEWSYYKVFPSGHKLNDVLKSAVKEALSSESGNDVAQNQPKEPVTRQDPSKRHQADIVQIPDVGVAQQDIANVVLQQPPNRSVIQQAVSSQQRPSTSAIQQKTIQQQQQLSTPIAPFKTLAPQRPATPLQRRPGTPMHRSLPTSSMPPSIPRRSRSRSRSKTRIPASVENEKWPLVKSSSPAQTLENQQRVGPIPSFGRSASVTNIAEGSPKTAGSLINYQVSTAQTGNRITNPVNPIKQSPPGKPAAVVMGRQVPHPSSIIMGNHASRPNGTVIQNSWQKQNATKSLPPYAASPNMTVQKVENSEVLNNVRIQPNGRSLPNMLGTSCNGYKRPSIGFGTPAPQKISKVASEDDVIVLSSDDET